MILGTIITILILLVGIFGYTTFNLLRKNEKAEDILLSQQEFIDKLTTQINYSEKKLEQIDNKGLFKSDDEIGWFFNEIKVLQNKLSQFKPNF
jgi:hypothetical protein|tara:strand:+ start:169 stop:447 length:279 start_codon:yes stop_codon:yes gene_type:complete